jgi:hypothetical protein
MNRSRTPRITGFDDDLGVRRVGSYYFQTDQRSVAAVYVGLTPRAVTSFRHAGTVRPLSQANRVKL